MAILGGLGAAVAWAVTLLCTSRATRMIGSGSVLAWVMLTGFRLLPQVYDLLVGPLMSRIAPATARLG